MDYTKATNEQLETITRYDLDCSPSLLRGVVEEMLNRNMFDRVIVDCFHKVIGSIEWMNDAYKLDMEDFLQIGRMMIFKSVNRFEQGKGMSFTSFIFLRVQQEFSRTVDFLKSKKRDCNNDLSYNAESSEGEQYISFLPCSVNVEKYVINKLTVEEMLEEINEHQKKILFLRMEGYTFKEIGDKLGGVSHQAIIQSYQRAINKMRKGA